MDRKRKRTIYIDVLLLLMVLVMWWSVVMYACELRYLNFQTDRERKKTNAWTNEHFECDPTAFIIIFCSNHFRAFVHFLIEIVFYSPLCAIVVNTQPNLHACIRMINIEHITQTQTQAYTCASTLTHMGTQRSNLRSIERVAFFLLRLYCCFVCCYYGVIYLAVRFIILFCCMSVYVVFLLVRWLDGERA